MKARNDLDFLANYWIDAKKIGQKIKKELSKTIGTQVTSKSKTGLLCFVKHSDIMNSWSVNDLLAKVYGESPTLQILADKIDYMINMGRGNDVPIMIKKICTGRIKSISHITTSKGLNSTYLGKGHFRWNYKAHTLNQKEIKHLKEYFKL